MDYPETRGDRWNHERKVTGLFSRESFEPTNRPQSITLERQGLPKRGEETQALIFEIQPNKTRHSNLPKISFRTDRCPLLLEHWTTRLSMILPHLEEHLVGELIGTIGPLTVHALPEASQ